MSLIVHLSKSQGLDIGASVAGSFGLMKMEATYWSLIDIRDRSRYFQILSLVPSQFLVDLFVVFDLMKSVTIE